MEGGGFEPPKAEPSDLQSDPFDRSGTPPKMQARYFLAGAAECQHIYRKIEERLDPTLKSDPVILPMRNFRL